MRRRRRATPATTPTPTSTPIPAPEVAGPRRRISWLRLLGVVVVSTATLAAATTWAVATVGDTFGASNAVAFSPYVDVTLTPTAHFEDPLANPATDAVLGFVVADPADGCTPTWGTYYDLDAAGRALDLDRRIARHRARGGDVSVSFGGQANAELATTCTDVDQLADAYRLVIDRYDLSVLDFDVEGVALADVEANQRRAEALAKVQADRDVAVWLTVPVATTGMLDEGVDLLDTTLAAGVDLAGVNGMTMNFGIDGDTTMGQAAIDALTGLRGQVGAAWARTGTTLTPATAWSKVGATPMVGRNDVGTEVFDLADARELAGFAADAGLGRVSIWSLNRDADCGAGQGTGVSSTCSGVAQDGNAFALVFLDHAEPTVVTTEDAPTQSADDATTRSTETRDDPATSPYPIWRSSRTYEEGDKVVWHGTVYEAKWWSENDVPDAAVDQVWDAPWRQLGPVMDVDAEVIEDVRTPVEGDWPDWSADDVFVAGDEVQFDGMVFRARWWTQGGRPEQDPDRSFDHPWEYVADVAATPSSDQDPSPTETQTQTPSPTPSPGPGAEPVAGEGRPTS